MQLPQQSMIRKDVGPPCCSVSLHIPLLKNVPLCWTQYHLQDLRQLRTKPGQPLSALKGLESGIMFCTYDLLTSGATPAKPKKGGKVGRPPKAAAAPLHASSAAGYAYSGDGSSAGGLAGSRSSSLSRSGSAGLWDDENQPPPWERPQSPEEDEDWEAAAEEFGEPALRCLVA